MKRLLLLTFLLLAGQIQGEVRTIKGTVADTAGNPVAGAAIESPASVKSTQTDSDGLFLLELQPTLRGRTSISVTHPAYLPMEIEVDSDEAPTLKISLVQRNIAQEQVTVTEEMPAPGYAPIGSAASSIEPSDYLTELNSVGQLLENIPGVAPNGQGGLFVTYSVRGISKSRVLTSLGGMRLITERRAGISASFIDPFLLESLDIVRGPATTNHGAGALGGSIDLVPTHFSGWNLISGIGSAGNERFLGAGWGDDSFSAGAVIRKSENAESPDGRTLNSHFTQYSSVFSKSWRKDDLQTSILAVPTFGVDIGKSNTDYPKRETVYPHERHLLLSLSVERDDVWRVQAYTHPNSLETAQYEGNRVSEVRNDAFDFGLNAQRRFSIAPSISGRIGADYFGRRSVDSIESSRPRNGGPTLDTPMRTLNGAGQDELGVHGSILFRVGHTLVEGGSRFTVERMANRDLPSISSSAASGFIGLSVPLRHHLEFSASVGSGFRLPSLSERYYTGTTGRGQAVANPDLASERSLNLESGVRWLQERFIASAFAFRTNIRDYVERIELDRDTQTYVNLTRGIIQGVELETVLEPTPNWRLSGQYHVVSGYDSFDQPLSDIPVSRLTTGVLYKRSRWDIGTRVQFRAGKDRPGSGEKAIDSAQILSSHLGFNLMENLRASMVVSNILDETFYNTADKKSPLAAGRGVQFALIWHPTGADSR